MLIPTIKESILIHYKVLILQMRLLPSHSFCFVTWSSIIIVIFNMGNRAKQLHDVPEREVKSQGKAYEVRKIRNVKFCPETLQQLYLISWKGYGRDEDSWEPTSCLWGCDDKLNEFKQRVAHFQAHISR